MDEHKKIARWLYDKITTQGFADHYAVVREIIDQFGEQYTYISDNSGNPVIDRGVLLEFRKLKNDDIVWNSRVLCWYVRGKEDVEVEELVNIESTGVEPIEVELLMSEYDGLLTDEYKLPEDELPEFNLADLEEET